MLKSSTQFFLSFSIPILFFSMEMFSSFLYEAPPLVSGGTQIEVSVSTSSDDAEEGATGSMSLTSSDIEMVQDGSTQKVGLRFQSISIPQGAKIVAAYIEFNADESNTTATSLTISGDDTGSALTFDGTNKVSTRTKTTASVSWTPGAWTIGTTYKTSNFASVVEEIVSRSDWSSGQDIALLIEGTGKRVADSFDESGGIPAKLVVVYDNTSNTANLLKKSVQTDNNSEFFSYDPDPNCTSADWESDWTKFKTLEGFEFEEYDDGSMIGYGTVVDIVDNNNRWDLYFRFENKRTWTEWDALGRMFYQSGAGTCNSNHVDWDYYEIDSLTSRIVGTTGYANEGKYSKIRHNPTDYIKGTQVGFGANNQNHGNTVTCQTYDIRGWCNFSGDLNLSCADFGFNTAGYEENNQCLIPNGGFEDDMDFWYTEGTSSEVFITSDAYTGNKAVRISGENRSVNILMSSAKPGEAFVFSGYGKKDAGVGWTSLSMRFYDKDRNRLFQNASEVQNGTYSLLTTGGIAPPNTHFVDAQLWKGTGTGNATFDDICLKRVPDPTNEDCVAITNSGFESPIGTEWSPTGSVTQTTDATEGTYAALIGGGIDGGIATSFSAAPNKFYEFSISIKETGTIGWSGMGLTFYDANWNELSNSITDVFSSNYETYSIVMESPPNTAHVNFWLSKYGTGDLYADAVCLSPISVYENCTDGIDNDGDGLIDCDDPDCATNGNCTGACIGNNLGFEDDFTDWTAINGVTISSDAAVGSKSAYMNADDEKVQQVFSVQSDSLYQISFWAKGVVGVNDWSGASLKFYDVSDTYLGQIDVNTWGYTDWNQFFKFVKAPTNSSYVRLSLAVYGSSSEMYFDDVCFQKSSYNIPVPNYSGCEIYPPTEGKTTFWFKNDLGWVVHDVMKGAVLSDNGDGTKTVRATVLNGRYETAYPCGQVDGWEVEVLLSDKQNWATWNGGYDNHNVANKGCTDYHTDWDYWEVAGGTVTGLGCNAGQIYNVTGNVSGYRVQVGEGANRNGCDFGLAGWITYDNNGTTESFDLYFDIDESCYEVPTVCPNLLTNGEFDNGTNNWGFYQQSGNTATRSIDNTNQLSGSNSTLINISTASGTAWHIQLAQDGLSLESGKDYVVSFEAKAATNRNIHIALQKAVSPWSGYWGQTVALTTTAQTYSFDYNSTVDDFGDVGLYFNLAETSGNVWIDNVVFKEKCSEICDNVIDDDGDNAADCVDTECSPHNVSATSSHPNNCPNLDNGQIVITASGENLQYSIDDGVTYQSFNTFTNLSDGSYIVKVRNSVTSCTVTVSTETLTNSTCTGSNCALTNPYPGFPIDFLNDNTGWVDYDLSNNLTLIDNGNGTMTISGSIENGTPIDFGSGMNGTSCGATDGWTLNLTLSDRKNWTEWQAMGGTANLNGSCSSSASGLDFWDISGTLTGTGCNAGRTLNITGPKSPYRLQIGNGGNNGDASCAFGMSTWFDGNEGGSAFNSDIYAFLDANCYSSSDCAITISTPTVSACIEQPLRDVATVSVDISWAGATANDTMEVTLGNKTEYILLAEGATSPQTIEFVVPADGTNGNTISATWRNGASSCDASTTFNAPSSCSTDEIACKILYLCGNDKPYDGDAWDHGFFNYLDEMNGAETVTPILTKEDASGAGTYDINNPSTFVNVTLTDYDLIVISATTEKYISADLVSALKEFPGSILNSNYTIINDLGMSSTEGGYTWGTDAYISDSDSEEIYDFDNLNAWGSNVITRGDYTSGGDGYLWAYANNESSGTNGHIFHYKENDALPGVTAHGSRTYLGYHMNGFFANSENGGVLPAPASSYFVPENDLTLIGKQYFDQALVLASIACNDEICGNGLDDDGDGFDDCTDADCNPPSGTLTTTNPDNCPDYNNGTIVVTATGSNLEYSKDNGTTYQSSNTFTNLSASTYIIRVRNSVSGCSTLISDGSKPTVTLTDDVCVEICDNNIDDDNDGIVDCADSDCGGINIIDVTISDCIDQPLVDVATLDITLTWTVAPPNDYIQLNIRGKKEYIDVPNGATSPHVISVLVEADGSSNNSVTASWKNHPEKCTDSALFNAPSSCSNAKRIGCNILYLCGNNKFQDAEPWDHGMVEYFDKINGVNILTPVVTKADLGGVGLYDAMDPSVQLSITFSDYDLIVISPSVGSQTAPDLIDTLKQFPGGILNMERRISDELGMTSSDGWFDSGTDVYTDNTTFFTVYNYDNPNPIWGIGRTAYSYNAGGDVFLWKSVWNASSGGNGVMFFFDESDGLPGIPSHGDRVQLGYHMDGFYYNAENGGATPTPASEWFDPVKHLTLEGKLYLDSAIVLAASSCNLEPEICDDGIDNDGDGATDCLDPDCKGSISVVSNIPFIGCSGGGSQIDVTATGTAPFAYSWNDMAADARWTFESTLDDFTGNGNDENGGNTGTIAYSNDAIEGQESMQFDGDDYLRYSVDGLFMESAFTEMYFSAWIKPSDLAGIKTIFEEGSASVGVGLRLNGRTLEGSVTSGSVQFEAGTLTLPSDGEWHHVALTFENGNLRVYIDGTGGTTTTASYTSIGSHSGDGGLGYQDNGSAFGTGSGNYYSGLMDDVRISHSGTLSPNQVIDLARNDGDRYHLEDGTYNVTVTNAANCVDSDVESVVITNHKNVTIGGTISEDQTICRGETPDAFMSLTDASGGNGLTIEYEWESSTDGSTWSVIGGAIYSTYTSGALTQTTYFRRGAARTNCPNKIYSNTIVVTVVENLTNPGTVSGNETNCGSYDPSEITSVSGASGGLGGTVEYQWQISTDGTNFSDVSGAITESFDPPTITQTTYYKRGARRSPCAAWEYSNVVIKTLVTNFTNGGIVSDDESNCGSYDPAMIVSTTAPSGGIGGTVEYVWEQNVDGAGWTVIPGANADSYDPSTITETTQYRRGARRGPCTTLIYSNTVTKTVDATTTAEITTYPTTSVTHFCENTDYTFAAANAGIGATYAWDFGAYATPATATGQGPHVVVFDVPNATPGTTFDVTLTTDLAGCKASDTKNFSVRPPLTVTSIDTEDPSTCSGSDGEIDVEVNSPSGLAYQISIDGGTTWANNNISVFSNLPAGTYNIQVRYGDTGACPVNYGVVTLEDPYLSNSGILANYTDECLNQTFEYSALFSLFIGAYTWDFGDGATPATATGIGPHDVTYSTPGNKVVTLTISGFGCSKDYSDLFMVSENYTNGGNIDGDQDLCGSFDPVEITATAAPTGGTGGTGEFQWEYRIQDGLGGWDEWIEITGATGTTYDPSTIMEPTQIRRKARRNPCADWLPTNEVTLSPAGQPTANPISFTTVCPGQPHGEDLSVNDLNLVDPVFSIYTQPANGTLSVFSDGQFLYDPNSTFCGMDEFVYEVCNYGGTCCDTARVTLNLTDGDAPTLYNIPEDITIACDEQVPLPPSVLAIENCLSVSLGMDEISTQGIDNCALYDYQITRIWTATDYCGNGESDSQIITIEDNTAPDIYRIYTLPNGKKMVAGVMENVTTRWKQITLPITFGTAPVVFTQLTSAADGSAAAIQMRNISKSQFEMQLVEEEAGDGIHARESVAWIAIEEGVQSDEMPFEVGKTTVSDALKNISFSASYAAPGIIASPQSSLETDPVGVRVSGLTGGSVNVQLQEDASADGETTHVFENLGYMVFNELGDFTLTGGEVIGETGMVMATDAWTTVSLSNTYKNPVVIANAPANSDTAPALATVKDVTATEFKIKLTEWDYLDGSHAIENVHYFVVEGSIPFDDEVACDMVPTTLDLNTEIIAVDNCDLAITLEFEETPANNNCAPDNEVIRSWSATDECGNTTMFTRSLTVIDTVAPTFTQPADLTIGCPDDIDDLTLTGDVFDEADNCATGLNASYTDIYPSVTDCGLGFIVERNWALSDGCGNVRTKTQNIHVISVGIQLKLKMLLQGAFFGVTSGDSLMRDDLRAKGILPLEEPYTELGGFDHKAGGGGETVLPAVFDVTGKDAIVDWIFVEIRHDTILDSVMATRSALVQRDGDIVDVDGISPIFFPTMTPGEYNVAIRHRNHLGAMTGHAKLINDDPDMSYTDFTSNADTVRAMTEPHYECADFDGDGTMVICKEDGTTLNIAESAWSTQQTAGAVCGPCGDYMTIADGDWMDGSIWKNGTPPSKTVDGVDILINHDLTVNSTVLIENEGMVWIENGSLDITGGLVVKKGQFQSRGSVITTSVNLQMEDDGAKVEMIGSTLNISGLSEINKGTAYFEATCLDVEAGISIKDAEVHFVRSRIDINTGGFTLAYDQGVAKVYNVDSKFHVMNGNFEVNGGFYGNVDAIWLENGELINNSYEEDIAAGQVPCEDYNGDGTFLVCRNGSVTTLVSTLGSNDVCGPCSEYQTIKDGEWGDPTVWAGGNIPMEVGKSGFHVDNGEEVVINHNITATLASDEEIHLNNESIIWIENGSLELIGGKRIHLDDGYLAVRNGRLELDTKLEINQSAAVLEMVNSSLIIGTEFLMKDGRAHFVNTDVQIVDGFTMENGLTGFTNSCLTLDNANFELQGGDFSSTDSKFRITNGNWVSDANITGTIGGLWIENGDLDNSGGWSAEVQEHCISGNTSGVSSSYFTNSENCSGIATVLNSCGTAGPVVGTEEPFPCNDYDGDGQVLVCQGNSTTYVTTPGAGDVCGPCGNYRTISDGNWSNSSTWEGGNVPPTNLSDKEVIINHEVTLNSHLVVRNGSILWIENGTLTFGIFKNITIEDGEVLVRGGDLTHGNNIVMNHNNSKLEVVNGYFESDLTLYVEKGNAYFENSKVHIRNGIVASGGDITFNNSCFTNKPWYGGSGNITNSGANINISGSSFKFIKGGFVNSGTISGDITALWLPDGDLTNSSNWATDVSDYCISGAITGVSASYLPPSENCSGISDLVGGCESVGDGFGPNGSDNGSGSGSGSGQDTTVVDSNFLWTATIDMYCMNAITGVDISYLPASQDCGMIASAIDACDCTTIIEDSEPVYMDSTMVTTAVAPWGTNALLQTRFGFVNWGADLNNDGYSIYQGPDTDITSIFVQVFTDPDNSEFHYPNFIREAYDQADYDMDGEVIFQGPGNDRAKLFFDVILRHPLNVGKLANFVVPEQLPENGN